MADSLNINLLIPFKDNSGARRNLYKAEIEKFRAQLDARASEIGDDLATIFGDNFELAISSRSDGTTRKYFWRFRSSKRDRKYVRLAAVSIQDYLRSLDREEMRHLKVLEEEIIYLNANLRLLKAMADSIEQSENEIAELRELAI
ncbi:hypothetical protein LCGC14_0749520 [marine sediment metagenome]|jgi:hypothetical protein|uniref:DUF3158 family protein n=2 Tax=root TaxID=1 RepID=A1U8A3_MARN8|nr:MULTISPECIES: hypothetical protein [Marinobacter]ABM21222.1 hypothetical protein Maqu_3943 [Marinobacter nauticus VT8]MBJ7276421.1 hypothetical protein [Marinobacter salarius]MBY5963602.1 hypothetical protein [Marinobacter nauticus]|tara:strand:+ start:227 stop:661 length:435 start_codon:yes stop_codon:yes gene_type:complete